MLDGVGLLGNCLGSKSFKALTSFMSSSNLQARRKTDGKFEPLLDWLDVEMRHWSMYKLFGLKEVFKRGLLDGYVGIES